MKNLNIDLLSKVAKYSSFALKGVDSFLSKTDSDDNKILFIIGAPRSGSTILYQVLTNYMDVLYLDNLTHLFHRNLPFGMWLSRKNYNGEPHNCYRSIHGSTMECGLHAPSEAGPFWRRMLPMKEHFLLPEEVAERNLEKVKKNLNSLMAKYQKPLIVKNLVLSQRLKLIAKLFPNAKIVFLKRNPLDNAKSIYKARKSLGIKKGEWWSVKPKNYKDLVSLNEIELAVKQVYYIEKQIREDLLLFPAENTAIFNYKKCLSDGFRESQDNIRQMLAPISFRSGYMEIKVEQKMSSIETDISSQLNAEISKLDWVNYGN